MVEAYAKRRLSTQIHSRCNAGNVWPPHPLGEGAAPADDVIAARAAA